jgi:methionyl-tRNA formyltransferase
MTNLRAVVFAYSEVGFVCLEELLRQGTDVKAVFTHEDDPSEERWFPSVAKLAREADIPVLTPETLGDEEYRLVKSLRPEAIFSFYYRSMIAERFLRIPPQGAFNMHGSLLPKYRGRACINWAILNGETETGATLHHMVKRADAGDIVDQEPVPILFEETALDISRKVAEAARIILERTLPAVAEGTASRTPQNEAEATYFGRRTPADGRISWRKSAVSIHNLVRAVTRPFPGAFTFFEGKKLFLWRTTTEEELPFAEALPGTVLSVDPFRVAADRDILRVLRRQWEGGEEQGDDGPETVVKKGDLLGG